MIPAVGLVVSGFGRIGRRLVHCAASLSWVGAIAVDDPAYDEASVIAMLRWDSIYGRSLLPIGHDPCGVLRIGDHPLRVNDEGSAVVSIDATGGQAANRADASHYYITDDATRCATTFNGLRPEPVYLGTCDGRALLPIVLATTALAKVERVIVTTVHPALSTQPILDRGLASAENRALERSALRHIIPKATSLGRILATACGIPANRVVTTSVRSPHDCVTTAVVDIIVEICDPDSILNQIATTADVPIIKECIVSGQAVGLPVCMVGPLSTALSDHIHLVIMYDNEMGYAVSVMSALGRAHGQRTE